MSQKRRNSPVTQQREVTTGEPDPCSSSYVLPRQRATRFLRPHRASGHGRCADPQSAASSANTP